MPTGIYDNSKRNIQGLKRFKKGEHTLQLKLKIEKKIKKVESFKNGLDIECKKHGSHSKWRLHTGNNVQCLFCAAEWQMAQRRRNPLRFMYRDAKKHAESRGREFSLTLEQMQGKMTSQMNQCIYTGLDFDSDNPPSLDRINSEIGYTIDNIQFVNIRVNKMKSDMTEQEFIKMCSLVARKGKKKKK